MGKLFAGTMMTLLMLCRPEAAANGAREGLRQWYFVVAPSLYPFMALTPLMTCREATRLYDAALGGVMRGLFGLPGSAASPMIVGMIAGSPAGCLAARSVAREGGFTRGQLARVAVACCGLSPAFFISAVGAGMLGDVAAGHLLLRSQLIAQIVMLGLTRRFCRDDTPVEIADAGAAVDPVLSIIKVAGYMALFGAVAGALNLPWTQIALDVTAGSRYICAMNIGSAWKLPALSALAGYGGLCVCAQNIGVLRGCGVNPVKFVLARCLAGALAAGLTALQMRIDWTEISANHSEIISISCIFAVFLTLPALFRLKKTIF